MNTALRTEQRDPDTVWIDDQPTSTVIGMLLSHDRHAIDAADRVREPLAEAVDATVARLRLGGTVHYFGAGASGRLAMLDASEITPTFGMAPDVFTSHFPGGSAALLDSSIDLEDSIDNGRQDARTITETSAAVGVSASGRTPYVAGALETARSKGALTILVTCNPEAELRQMADITVAADTGAEALTGSTRLSAGTATKTILSAFSTAIMIKLGRVYSNLMIGVRPTNEKLRARAVGILAELTHAPDAVCRAALEAADSDVAVALLSLLSEKDIETAQAALRTANSVREAEHLLGREAIQ